MSPFAKQFDEKSGQPARRGGGQIIEHQAQEGCEPQ